MPELIRSSEPPQQDVSISNALTGFTVVDRENEHVGIVTSVNIERTCLLIESTGSLFRRKQHHAVHLSAIKTIDIDHFTIVLAVSKDDVANAPEFHHLDAHAHTAIANHYSDRMPAASS